MPLITLCTQEQVLKVSMKNQYIDLIGALCTPASSQDIQSWSYGAVAKLRQSQPTSWRSTKGTLDDEAIFGPTTSFQCACLKYSTAEFAEAICDICGVKVTMNSSRFERFGHINLKIHLVHETCGKREELDAFPVLPAAFRESHDGRVLNGLYEKMIQASDEGNRLLLKNTYEEIIESITPIVGAMVAWNLPNAALIARGIALIWKERE